MTDVKYFKRVIWKIAVYFMQVLSESFAKE